MLAVGAAATPATRARAVVPIRSATYESPTPLATWGLGLTSPEECSIDVGCRHYVPKTVCGESAGLDTPTDAKISLWCLVQKHDCHLPCIRRIRAPAARPDGRNVPLRNAIMQCIWLVLTRRHSRHTWFSREEREERRPDARFYEAHRPEKLTERDFIDFICNVGSQDTPCFELGSAVSPRFTRAAKLNWMRCVLV